MRSPFAWLLAASSAFTPFAWLLAALLALAALAVPVPAARAVAPGIVFGLHQTEPEPVAAKRLNAKWARLYLDWADAEPARGVLNEALLADYERRVDELRRVGTRTLIVVSTTPTWARKGASPLSPPRDPGRYGSFMGRLAKRLPAVRAWEIWNEPDLEMFWAGGPQPRVYTRMLRSAYRHVKRAQPKDTVVLGGLVGSDIPFLRAVYRAGGKGSFDAVGVHYATACLTVGPHFHYFDPDHRVGRYVFSSFRELHRFMRARGDGRKKLWVTELGWNTGLTGPTTCNYGHWAGQKAMGVSERTQQLHLRRAFACLAAHRYVKAAFWFSAQDVSDEPTWEHHLGLIRRNGSLKPAARTFRLAGRISPRPCGPPLRVLPRP